MRRRSRERTTSKGDTVYPTGAVPLFSSIQALYTALYPTPLFTKPHTGNIRLGAPLCCMASVLTTQVFLTMRSALGLTVAVVQIPLVDVDKRLML